MIKKAIFIVTWSKQKAETETVTACRHHHVNSPSVLLSLSICLSLVKVPHSSGWYPDTCAMLLILRSWWSHIVGSVANTSYLLWIFVWVSHILFVNFRVFRISVVAFGCWGCYGEKNELRAAVSKILWCCLLLGLVVCMSGMRCLSLCLAVWLSGTASSLAVW